VAAVRLKTERGGIADEPGLFREERAKPPAPQLLPSSRATPALPRTADEKSPRKRAGTVYEFLYNGRQNGPGAYLLLTREVLQASTSGLTV
jgi:hypothetical protein